MKKITKFLDSVMGGIKRTCIAKALAVFAVASIAINANAQTVDDQGVVTGIDKLVGKTQTELLKKPSQAQLSRPIRRSSSSFIT